MAQLQFQPPNFDPRRKDNEQTLQMLSQAPSLLMQYRQLQQQKDLAQKEYELKIAQMEFEKRRYLGDTSSSAPVSSPQMGTPGAAGSSMLPGMLNPMNTPVNETPEQRLMRMGGEENLNIYRATNQPSYVAIGNNGEQIQLPAGARPFNLPAAQSPNLIQPVDVMGLPVGEPKNVGAGKVIITKPEQQQRQIASSASPADKELHKKVVDAFDDYSQTKPETESVIKKLGELREINKNTYDSGIGTKIKGKFSQLTGIGANSEKFKSTEKVIGELKTLVASALKGTFVGALSNDERKYLNEVYGAADNMSKQQRDIAFNRIEKMASNRLIKSQEKYNTLLGAQSGGLSPVKTGGGMVRIIDSSGGEHLIPSGNLEKARQRDPGLQVIQ